MKRVYLTEKIHEDAIRCLRQHFDVVFGYELPDEEERTRQIRECEGILVRSAHVTAELMRTAPNLKVVAKHGIGVDNIDVNEATARGIQVVNAPFSNINAVAEHTVALIFAVTKNLVYLDRRTREGAFSERNVYLNTELSGKTLGLVGFGKIARLVAKKMGGMDMTILTNDPYCDLEAAEELHVRPVSREELLAQSDIVSLHLPLMPETRRLVDAAFLKQMKPSACLINASRGAIVDEAALAEALRQGVISGAGLDVFDPEPPQSDNPLFSMGQVVVSPHNAALTDRAMLAMAMDSAEGVCDCLEGRKPRYPVNQV